ncbi:uncharacterized protein METZ01_LOCUS185297 [marine metagenome]|uniref:Uncharacterized protein n=1 Tax=marine metagenome TaxID=408172 RepID=A0A382D4G3_9ZZZZ
MAVQQYLMMGQASVQRKIITGSLWMWGQNNAGQLGLGHDTNAAHLQTGEGEFWGDIPHQVGSLTDWQNTFSCGNGYYQVVLTVKSDGTLWGWGQNNVGMLGLGDTTSRCSPTQVGSDTDWAEVIITSGNACFGIKTTGALYAWGDGVSGRLGLSSTTDYSSPVQVGSLTDWAHICQIGAGGRIVALKTDGTMWQWGSNWTTWHDGHFSSPVQVGTDTDWTDVMAAGYSAAYQINMAVKEA